MGAILEAQISLFLEESLSRGSRRAPGMLFEGAKKDLKLKGSWDRFLVDFGRVLGAAGEAKTWFSLESGTNFHIFGYLKRRCFLDTKKHRFWLRFGLQVGLQNRSSWLQDGFVSNKIGKMRVPRRCQKNDRVFEPS